MTINVVFIGKPESGKTQLINCLAGKPFNEQYKETTFLDFIKISELIVWDVPGHFEIEQLYFLNQSPDILCYCIDLTNPADNEKIKNKINKFKDKFPVTKIILVGTKSNTAPNADLSQFESIQSCYNAEFIVTFAKENRGIIELHELLKQLNQDENSAFINEVINLINLSENVKEFDKKEFGKLISDSSQDTINVNITHYLNNRLASLAVKKILFTLLIGITLALFSLSIGYNIMLATGILSMTAVLIAGIISAGVGITSGAISYGLFKRHQTHEMDKLSTIIEKRYFETVGLTKKSIK